jgi:hypothetical protein
MFQGSGVRFKAVSARSSGRVFLAVLVVPLLTPLGAFGQPQRGRISAPVASFAHLPPGWREYRNLPGSTALNWDYEADPHGWAASMPRDGIAVSVYFPQPGGKQHYRPLRLVLPRRPATLLEGTRDTPEYRIFGRVRGVDVNIFVDIRRLHPSGRQLRNAQRIVSAIRFSHR